MQAVADAYFVLSDPKRRQDYDVLYASRGDRTDDPTSSPGFFSQFFSSPGARRTDAPAEGQPDADGVFADVFDEVRLRIKYDVGQASNAMQLLRPEVERHTPWWSWLGAICGGGIGFIIANIPGLMLGAFAGNRLGAVRDAKGKSVASVFSELGGQQKAEVTKSISLEMLLFVLTFDVIHRFSVLWL